MIKACRCKPFFISIRFLSFPQIIKKKIFFEKKSQGSLPKGKSFVVLHRLTVLQDKQLTKSFYPILLWNRLILMMKPLRLP